MKAWGDWMPSTRSPSSRRAARSARRSGYQRKGIEAVRNQMAGFTIVQAESHEEAARLFEKHPHFSVFPGRGWRSWSARRSLGSTENKSPQSPGGPRGRS